MATLARKRKARDIDLLLVFVAPDRELKEAAQSSGLAVIDPEEQEKQATSLGDRVQEEDEA